MAKSDQGNGVPSKSKDAGSALTITTSGYRVAQDAIGLVGQTPLIRLGRLSPAHGGTVWAKCEFMNPGGSVKDRPALSMILQAEREGKLSEQSVIVEATSG